MGPTELIKRYYDSEVKYNEEGKRQFVFELLEYFNEEQLNKEIDHLIMLITKS